MHAGSFELSSTSWSIVAQHSQSATLLHGKGVASHWNAGVPRPDYTKDIKNTIKNEGFEKAALIHSTSETSENGGLLGWVKESSISKKIKIELKKIDKENFTNPIQVPGGFIILFINEIRVSKKNIDFEKELNSIIREKTNNQLNQFSNIYFNKIKKNMEINEI